MTPILHSFNVRKTDQNKFKNLKNQVQLSFNASAPVTKTDQLTWIFMNAIDIFLAKDQQGRQDQLTKFTNSNGQGTPLDSTPKVSITNGIVSLQVTALGQKQDGLFVKIFDAVTKIASSLGSSPIVSAAKGFGIPGLATQALTFVDGVLDVIAKQDKLETLWQTAGFLDFAVTQDATARFSMVPGLCAIVDSDYAQSSSYLEGHSIDLLYNSFRLTDKKGSPADANYVVVDMKFATA